MNREVLIILVGFIIIWTVIWKFNQLRKASIKRHRSHLKQTEDTLKRLAELINDREEIYEEDCMIDDRFLHSVPMYENPPPPPPKI